MTRSHQKGRKRRTKGVTAGPTMRDYDRFYQAAANLIRKSGGTALVASGVQVIQFPEDSAFNYTFGCRITGRKPPYEGKKNLAVGCAPAPSAGLSRASRSGSSRSLAEDGEGS